MQAQIAPPSDVASNHKSEAALPSKRMIAKKQIIQ